jgi:CMP-N,N'-diacetyllegionaminic acid synthase
MKILALILARGGSKRLPNKNILPLGGKPLVSWSIDVAKDIPEICEIMVSTDNKEIKEVAKKAGAYVPWLRPDDLSNDDSNSVDAAIHALDWYETNHGKVDGLMLLQPTSPFRTSTSIKEGIRLFSKFKMITVIGVSQTHQHPNWTFRIKQEVLTPFFDGSGLNTRSQDLDPAFIVNGSFYLISPQNLRVSKSFFGGTLTPLVIDSRIESIDIDTEEDFNYAKYCWNFLSK